MTPILEWSHPSAPDATAMVSVVDVCPVSPGISSPGGGQPPWKVTCKKPWPITQNLWVFMRADFQSEVTLSIWTAHDGNGNVSGDRVAQYTGALVVEPLSEPWDWTLDGDVSPPDLDGYHVTTFPNETQDNVTWSVWRLPGAAQIDLKACEEMATILQGRTGDGQALEAVDSANIWCGPMTEAAAFPCITIETSPRIPLAGLQTGGKQHRGASYLVTVHAKDLSGPKASYRQAAELQAQVASILGDENRNDTALGLTLALQVLGQEPPEQEGKDPLQWAAPMIVEASLLGTR